MKNKLITSMLVLTLTFSCGIATQAEESSSVKPTTTTETTGAGIAVLSATTGNVTGTQAVNAVNDSNVLIVDVRTKANYDKGHLTNSVSVPLFNAAGVTSGSDDLATAFTAYVTANTASFNGKDIYILCNSGSRGAQAATKLLQAAETNGLITPNGIYTITGGAKDTDVQTAFVIDYNFVSGASAVAAIDNDSVVIIDVRSASKYAAGHLKGSLSAPLFDANNAVTNGSDELASAFTSTITNNASNLSGKSIYILCNSGSRGAQNATKLLLNAGYDLANIYTITNGAKDIDIQNAMTSTPEDITPEKPTTPSVPSTPEDTTPSTGSTPTDKTPTTTSPATTSSSVPKTGDASTGMVYALLMTIAVAVIVRMKKKFTI